MKKFKITGTKYDTTPSYYDWDKKHKHPTYKQIDKMVLLEEGEFESVGEAEKWLLANYPEWWFGCSITEVDSTSEMPDFLVNALVEYYECSYHTTDRKEIIKKEIEKRGIELVKHNAICARSMDKLHDYIVLERKISDDSFHTGRIISYIYNQHMDSGETIDALLYVFPQLTKDELLPFVIGTGIQ